MTKETYICGKRDLLMWQKGPTYVAKEIYLCGKRDLLMWQKRPTYVAKETYLCGKRALLTKETYSHVYREKRPINTRAYLRRACSQRLGAPESAAGVVRSP